jgi:hypothetical protein
MTITFKYKDNEAGGKSFSCPLQCVPCKSKTKTGARCKRRVCIGLPKCWYHLLKEDKLKVQETQYGKGVMAWDDSKPNDAVIFKRGDLIADYNAESITRRESTRRYGRNRTAPYGLNMTGTANIQDGACKRGIGTLFNHTYDARPPADLVSRREHERAPYRLAVEANKNIKNKKEILVSYGQNYTFDRNVTHSTNSGKSKQPRRRRR